MRVFITGGTGQVGTAATALLVAEGYDVTVIGRRDEPPSPGSTYLQCDVADYDRLETLMRGHDAVVHLAAIPHPVGVAGREVFRANDLGTFNVFEAAVTVGIGRVVNASSINALGYFFGDRGFPLPYLPADENSPKLATDAYSFSKQIAERIGDYFWERDGISSVHLRLPSVLTHDRVLSGTVWGMIPDALISELLSLPLDRRRERMQTIHEGYDRYRRANRLDQQTSFPRRPSNDAPRGSLTAEEYGLMHQMVNFFAYIDELDSARAIERAIVADFSGSHPLFVNARRNAMGLPVSEMATLYWPPVEEIRRQHPGDDCLCSIDRARELIGFDPRWEIEAERPTDEA